jgi:hypothetical protein
METAAIGQECVIAVDVYIYAYPLVIAEPTCHVCQRRGAHRERRPGSGIWPFLEGQD